ncbi:acetyl-CoA carboxylase biotin carboxylase subunit [Desulfotomaculum copahuensis]|nr:acetyl-CoA carboxylase biotin carboxylase subunit [Desulfotomaculum copahuensis]
MFKKILIANRGEIALRIIHACKEMGIDSVMTYTDADKESLPCRKASETYNLGAPREYLNIEKIVFAAKKTGAEAIHPGYGFLAENPAFARACLDAGLVFIGPSPEVMKLMGDKVQAKETAQKAGVPVVPGSSGAVATIAEAEAIAAQMGYPLLIKASAGGGGRGMRLAQNVTDLSRAFMSACTEAQSCFGDSSVYLEKYITEPRHVEIQLLADNFGNVVFLGERDCSLQRRHQKILEEAPCPVLSVTTAQKMGDVAVRLAKQVGYRGVGTVEFLLDADEKFYFMEMNTRIQVEHPVTEMVTGVDIVKEQIRIAAGLPLSFQQHDIKIRGAAIECRINAEDPAQNFLPNPGTIRQYVPPAGFGVRVESAVFPGYTIPNLYDSMIAKLISWGRDRQEAVARMQRALNDFVIEGVKTTIPFHQMILQHQDFQSGRVTTNFLAKNQTDLSKGFSVSTNLPHQKIVRKYHLTVNDVVYELTIAGRIAGE